MHFESTRFGTIEIRDDSILTFPEGLPGLPGERWALVTKDEESPFFWLHSVDHADLAVPVTSPWLFFSDYEVRLADDEARRLGLTDTADAFIVCVVRASAEISDCTINLASPVVIHTGSRLGRQIMNDAGGYSVRHPLFSEVELNDVQPATPMPLAAPAG